MIKLCRVKKVTDNPPVPNNYININALSWFPNNILRFRSQSIPLYELTPYHLRDENGSIFENFWQSTKIYRHVYAQKQIYASNITWEHQEEDHIDGEGHVLPAYWIWRFKLMFNPYPVRYPNGYDHRHEVSCALWPTTEGKYEPLTYIEGRKKIYCSEYSRLVQKTSAFHALKDLVRSGHNLQILDVDVPGGEYDESLITLIRGEDGETLYKQYLHNTMISFGHSWTLAACLLDFPLDKILAS